MDIERINENTVKFYISYIDIEKRGFSRDEIWFNRDKSEELFWEMMDEINDESEFEVEGPLWIQVHALEKGLEVTVTRAGANKEGKNGFIEPDERDSYYSSISEAGGNQKYNDIADLYAELEVDLMEHTFVFREFDDIIPLAKRMEIPSNVSSSFHFFEGKYYLYLELMDEEDEALEAFENLASVVQEYATDSTVTIHRLEEYGKEIISDEVFDHIRNYF
ncbi:adaptor protein MecA [Paenisporosarcina cavernae]|uniref:Adapter protein MecA n=1 Tax=Paenisporosarcina cavernae TaxID=2320858 RepID=A0A385YSQ5_9BACL|nr:adaptor protein MecA [Paenisporosarcina cavernae]AYC29017.1 adaptor protein MecA [Paenisporosarcina cavernae]